MQKLPFEYILRSVTLEKDKFMRFQMFLKSKKITFSRWVREKIEEELKKTSF